MDAMDVDSATPLECAARVGHVDVVRTLMTAGDVTRQSPLLLRVRELARRWSRAAVLSLVDDVARGAIVLGAAGATVESGVDSSNGAGELGKRAHGSASLWQRSNVQPADDSDANALTSPWSHLAALLDVPHVVNTASENAVDTPVMDDGMTPRSRIRHRRRTHTPRRDRSSRLAAVHTAES